jgi:hypothetical protein
MKKRVIEVRGKKATPNEKKNKILRTGLEFSCENPSGSFFFF